MEFASRYQSHIPDARGHISYSEAEQRVWGQLFREQEQLVQGRACNEFLQGLDRLGLNAAAIPQLPEISQRLKALTGWEVVPVPALIPARSFFELLAQKQFPAATFIRAEEELHYVKEPDIFHELFGHCPMLTQPVYADFMHRFALRVLDFPEQDWPLLQRFFWFTVEFGLIQTADGIRAYGGGILSSIQETAYSVESDLALRVCFEPLAVFRTPYRIDRLQPLYFLIQNYEQLYAFVDQDIASYLARAREYKELPALFTVDENNPSVHIHAC